MANVRISELPAATLPLTGAELVPVVQSGVTKQTTAAGAGANVVNVKAYGSFASPTSRAAALLAALNAADTVFVPAGIYDPVTIAQSNKTLIMDGGVEFKLPDNTVSSVATTGPAVFQISGNNVTVRGNFVVNGNRAANSSYSINTPIRIGTLYVTGNNAKFFGEVYVKNAYWMGFSAEGGSTTGTEITGLYIDRLIVEDAAYHSVLMWSVTDWRINQIVATNTGTVSPWLYGNKDPRVRFGTQLSNTSQCKNGSVDSIITDKNVTVTFEQRVQNVTAGSVLCGGSKVQNSNDVTIGAWVAWDASVQNQAHGLAIIDSARVSIGNMMVKSYDCEVGYSGYPIIFNGATNCTIGSVVVTGTLSSTAGTFDMIIRTADNLNIGQVTLVSPVGTIGGFLFDYDVAYAPQQDIVVDSLVSRGHTGFDVIVEAKSPIKIGAINSDAVEQYPNNRNNMAVVRESTWTPTISRSGSAVTYSLQSGRFSVIGRMVIASFDMVISTVTTQGTGFWAISLPIAARASYIPQAGSLLFRQAASGALGVGTPSGTSELRLINSTGTDWFNGSLGTGTLSGTICYVID